MANWPLNTNKEVRKLMEEKRVPRWKIADYYGVHTNTVGNWFRHEFSEEKKAKMIKVINEIAENEQGA